MKHVSQPFLVRGFHCDSYGHVNHSRYFEFMEEARWQLLSQPHLEEFIRASNLQFFIVQINMSFKLPLMPGDQFTIETAFHSNTRKSITLEQILINDKGEKTNRAEVTFVLYDPALKKSVSLNEKMIQLFSS